MYGFLLTVLVLDGLFLSVVILLQAGKGGGLAAVGGSGGTMADGVLGGRQATTVLTRATWTAGTIFMVLALVLSILSSRARAPSSVIQVDVPQETTAPQPVLPGLGEDVPPPPPAGSEGNDGNDGN
ncbi:MAG: preprotein translocase subunit SecG [Longimicrobiales bacterium]|nr:preprotein translocase subunit SecG [Longimicrobiales bacterium]